MNIELTPMTEFQFRVDPHSKYVTSHETQELVTKSQTQKPKAMAMVSADLALH